MDCIKAKPDVIVARTILCTPQDLRDFADVMEKSSKENHESMIPLTSDIYLVYKAPFDHQFSLSVSKESAPLPTH